jgi:hypothetical protein
MGRGAIGVGKKSLARPAPSPVEDIRAEETPVFAG